MTTSPIPDPINSRIQQHGWIPLELLGQGGGATVYFCAKAEVAQVIQDLMKQSSGAVRDLQKDLEIACKVVQKLSFNLVAQRNALAALKIPKSLDDLDTFERLKREIAAMNAVKHPALIRLLDADKNEPPQWFVMELHLGGNLSAIATQYQGRVAETLEAILPIVEALAVLHEKGFVHRDIKPSNIFISDQGKLVLGDFGIVFPKDSGGTRLTDPSSTLFSRDWIPDWARFTESPPQSKIDVFMLGKVIYFMVTGGQRVLASQLDEEAFDLRHRLKGQEGVAELQGLLTDCITTKEKDCKFENSGEFLIRLRELLNELTGKALETVIFNFLSVHSTTDVPIQRGYTEQPRYASLTRLQGFLPNKCKRFLVRARLSGPSRSERFRLFLQIDKRHMTSSEGHSFEMMADNHDRGTWTTDFLIQLTVPLNRGWHALDITITSETDGHKITGFMLCAG